MTTPTQPIRIQPATAALAPAITALFDAAGSPCFCRYWHFPGDNTAWLRRCDGDPAANRRDYLAAAAAGSAETQGVVALATKDGQDLVVGWLKAAPAPAMDKLYSLRARRGLPLCDGRGPTTFVLGCALVHPDFRRQGVTVALVEGAVRAAATWGAQILEAYPRRYSGAVDADHLWPGPESAFHRCGFSEAAAHPEFPVLRKVPGTP